ncbi:MAG: hypothetical protein KGL29_02315 [Alphaproteobacteria bacterium]|nr:hypothetical protein [Alphaproteobacteria bacterium]
MPRTLHDTILPAIVLVILAGVVTSNHALAATVILAPADLKANGIVTAQLQTQSYRAQAEGIATVVDPQALTALAAQLATAHAAVEAANEEVMATAAESKRQQALYRNGKYVSERDEQTAIAAAAAAKAQRVSAIAADSSTRANAVATWGAALAAIAEQGPGAFADYADGRRALLAIALPIGTSAMPEKVIEILLPTGPALSASLIGPSPRADTIVQGPSYYYSTAGEGLRSGQRFAAVVGIGASSATGVVIPDAAVLWYAGEPWVYVETAPGHFTRRLIITDARDAKGWFQVKGFKAGERVVVHGSELLLSQELKPPASATSAGGDDDD